VPGLPNRYRGLRPIASADETGQAMLVPCLMIQPVRLEPSDDRTTGKMTSAGTSSTSTSSSGNDSGGRDRPPTPPRPPRSSSKLFSNNALSDLTGGAPTFKFKTYPGLLGARARWARRWSYSGARCVLGRRNGPKYFALGQVRALKVQKRSRSHRRIRPCLDPLSVSLGAVGLAKEVTLGTFVAPTRFHRHAPAHARSAARTSTLLLVQGREGHPGLQVQKVATGRRQPQGRQVQVRSRARQRRRAPPGGLRPRHARPARVRPTRTPTRARPSRSCRPTPYGWPTASTTPSSRAAWSTS
jgi:hypothetical protein